MSYLAGKSVLVTGGTGWFGKAVIRRALGGIGVPRLAMYSRNQLKQWEVRNLFADKPRLRWFIGDVANEQRLLRATDAGNSVIHAAALKQAEAAEYNPLEAIKANVIHGENPINAAMNNDTNANDIQGKLS